METFFFVLLGLSLYPYLLYPPLLWLISVFLRKPWHQGEIRPSISLIISAYNEETVIAEKLSNTTALAYPAHLLEIIVSSDGSDDRTNTIVRSVSDEDPRVTLKVFSRQGKTACLNMVVPQAAGDIILFTDANALFPPDLLMKIIRNFKDERVGAVTGWTKYGKMEKVEAEPGLYTSLERFLKFRESVVSSCVGADGAIFAIRKELFRPLEKEDINDFVVPLTIIRQGKRVVLDPNVFCYEETPGSGQNELTRQARITNRTLAAILRYRSCLNPFSFPAFFFLISHKLLRFSMPLFLAGLLTVSAILATRSSSYAVLFALEILTILGCFTAFSGLYRGRGSAFVSFAFASLAAQTIAWLRLFLGKVEVTWTPGRTSRPFYKIQ